MTTGEGAGPMAGAGWDAPPDGPLIEVSPAEPGGRSFRRKESETIIDLVRDAVGFRVDVEDWFESVSFRLSPADAVLIGRALVEMGEAMARETAT